METVTCHLMWASAKEAANYSLTCKYSWKMIVHIWTSAILIKYFDYFWDRLWEREGGVVKGINLLIAGNEVVFLRNCCRRPCLNFPPSFLCPPSLTYSFESSHHSSACSWSPLALCPCQFLKIITHLTPQAGRNLNGRDKEELLAGNQSGSCLSQSPGFPAFYTHKISNPEMASFQLLHWVPHASTNRKSWLELPWNGRGKRKLVQPKESGPP